MAPQIPVQLSEKKISKLRTTALSVLMTSLLYSTHIYAQVVDLNLPAQSLQQSIVQLARQGDVEIIYVGDILKNKIAPKIQGKISIEQALQQLLQGTNLSLQKDGNTFFIVEKSFDLQSINFSEDNKKIYQNFLYQLPVIVVDADKTQFGQSSLNQTSIDRYQANNIAQLLDNMPSVSSAGSPRPGGQTINILGMGAVEDVPITIDDSLKTFDKYRQGSVFIEPEVLKTITVNKGPHDVETGNGGFGGSVVVDTRDATDFLKEDQQVGAFLKYSRFSNNYQNTYSGAVFGQTPNKVMDGMVYYTKRDSGNVGRPDGSEFLYSAQEQNTYLTKFNIYLPADQKISFKAMYSEHEGWEPFAAKRDQDAVPTAADLERYGYDEAWKRRLVYRDQQDSSYSLGYEYQPVENPYINLKAVASYSVTKQHDRRLPDVNMLASNLGNKSWVDYKNTSFKVTNISDIATDYGTHKIKTGLQYQKMKQQSLIHVLSNIGNPEYNYGYFEPNFMPAGEQNLFAAFIEDQYQFNTFTITPSIRYDHISNEGYGNRAPRYSHLEVGQDYSKKTYTGWSPRLALAWQQNDQLTWFANVSHTWRAPRVDEQYYVDGPTATVPATSLYLLPEKMLAIRLGNEVSFDGLLHDDDYLKARFTYHHNRGKNEIFRNRSVFCKAQADIIASGNSANSSVCDGNYDHGFYRNLTPYTIKGYEAEIFYEQPIFFAGLTYAYIRGQRDNSPVNPWFAQKTWIEDVPPRKATATLGFKVPQQNLTFGWRGVFVDKQDRSILNTDRSVGASGFSLPRTSGYSLHNIFAEWLPLKDESIKVNAGIDNLFNKDYKMYLGEYMTGTGRDYKLSVSYQF